MEAAVVRFDTQKSLPIPVWPYPFSYLVSVKIPPFSGDCQEKNMNIFYRNIKFIGEFYRIIADYP
ncbi:MAG: hypothetical protein OXC62_11460, partial [Aestuariivita sp.]|nr:hypothetical protein [Aestuariivita sp.]